MFVFHFHFQYNVYKNEVVKSNWKVSISQEIFYHYFMVKSYKSVSSIVA